MIQYLTIHSTALLSSSLSRYKDDHSHKLSHVYKLSLLLNEKFEYLLSTNTYSNSNSNSNLATDDNYTNLNGSFHRIMMMMNNNENKKKIFLKRRQ